jgi:4-carboxymuconolactone decarboxylase
VDQETYDKGIEIRSAVLGEAYVNKALTEADDFSKPLQDLITDLPPG